MAYGWLKLHRELMDKPIWFQSTLEQKVILITLLMMVVHEEKEYIFNGEKVDLMPGQIGTSLDQIVEKTNKQVSVQNVRTALKRFEKLEFLTDQSVKGGRLITILNWGIYQGKHDKSLTSNLTPQLTPCLTPRLTGGEASGIKGFEDCLTRQLTPQLTSDLTSNLTPIKNKEYKENKNIYNNIYSQSELFPGAPPEEPEGIGVKASAEVQEIFEHWNEQKIVVHKKLTAELVKAIEKALRQYGGTRCREAIDLYSDAFYDEQFYFSHKWTLGKFLTQRNGIIDWLEEGQRYVEYNDHLEKPVDGEGR